MSITHNFYIGFKDIDKNLQAKNTKILTFFENMAGIHANLCGDGLRDTYERTHTTWLLLAWKVDVIRRPEYAEEVIAKTWVRSIRRFYSEREFELLSESGEVFVKAISKWVQVNVEKGEPCSCSDELSEKYGRGEYSNYESGINVKLKEPSSANSVYFHKVQSDWIDMNYHMNNTHYLTLAHMAIGKEIPQPDHFEILYKKEVKNGETLKCLVKETDEEYIVTIKSEDGELLHAIVRLLKQ